MMKPTVAFSNFVNVPKKQMLLYKWRVFQYPHDQPLKHIVQDQVLVQFCCKKIGIKNFITLNIGQEHVNPINS